MALYPASSVCRDLRYEPPNRLSHAATHSFMSIDGHSNCSCSRRQMIRSLVSGSLVLPGILSQLLADEAREGTNPLAPKAPHFPGKAKRVIFLYMTGGASHMDSFDP